MQVIQRKPVSALVQVAVVTFPPAQSVFEVAAGGPGRDWPLVLGLAVVPLAVIETLKLVASRRRHVRIDR